MLAHDGRPVTTLTDRATVLIPWIEGRAKTAQEMSSPAAIGELGRFCGSLHRLARDFPEARAVSAASCVSNSSLSSSEMVP